MEIAETKTTRHNIYQAVENFSKFDKSFQKIQPKLKRCFICKSNFKDDDNIHLVFLVASKNRIVCDKCLADIKVNHSDVKIRNIKSNR